MKLLLVKTSSLGDVIHALPAVSDLARRFPGAQIDWAVEEGFAAIPRLHPAVSATIPVAVRRWRTALLSPATWREMAGLRRVLRRPVGADFFAYDAVIDLQGLVKSALIAAQARGRTFGFAAPREGLAALAYDVAVEVPRALPAVTRNRLLAAGALGYALDALPLDYGLAAPPLPAGWLKAGAYAVLFTATSRADKEWPDADWTTLGAALADRGLRCVLPGGSAAERERARRIADGIAGAIAAPAMGLDDLAGLLGGARLAVGVDTGLVHLAAALGRPTVAIFCASDPALTGVLGTAPHANLGRPGLPPTAAEATDAALGLLAA
jgi:heptosyltransferase-1